MNWRIDNLVRVVLILAGSSCVSAGNDFYPVPDTIDFGTVNNGDVITGSFSVSGEGSDAVDITLIAGCSCMTVEPMEAHLEPDESITVFWTLNTEQYSGEVGFNVIVSGNGRAINHTISGVIIEKKLPPILIGFGTAVLVAVAVAIFFYRNKRTGDRVI